MMLKRTCMVGAVALFLVPTWATAQAPADDTAEPIIIEQVLVKVNGQIITKTDLEARQIEAIQGRGVQPTSDFEFVSLLREVTPGVIANAVDELLLVQRGRDLGYSLSDELFAEQVTEIREENEFETEQELETALREELGMTLGDFRRRMESQMLVSQVQQIEILGRVAITDVEAREYYDTHAEEFTQPATATLRQFLIPVAETPEGVSVAADDEARVVAQMTVARLRSGEDFAAVAAELSGSSSESAGGLFGPLLVSEFSDAIQELIASLDVGGVADPRRTPQGYQIVRLEARREPVVLPFDDVRDDISNNVFNDRRMRELSRYLDELRLEAVIEWKNDELRQVYEQFRADQADSASLGPVND